LGQVSSYIVLLKRLHLTRRLFAQQQLSEQLGGYCPPTCSVKFHFHYYRREGQKKYKTKVLFLHYPAIYGGIAVEILVFYCTAILHFPVFYARSSYRHFRNFFNIKVLNITL